MNERLKKFDAEEYMKGLRKAVTAGGDPVRITKISPVTGSGARRNITGRRTDWTPKVPTRLCRKW